MSHDQERKYGTPVGEFVEKGKREQARREIAKALQVLNDALQIAHAAKLVVSFSFSDQFCTATVSEVVPNEDDTNG